MKYDLEERTQKFTIDTRKFCQALSQSIANQQDIKQPVRASGSVGANYIEANESLGKKDFVLRLRIARKEAKEARFWLGVIDVSDSLVRSRDQLLQESTELLKILSSIIQKCL